MSTCDITLAGRLIGETVKQSARQKGAESLTLVNAGQPAQFTQSTQPQHTKRFSTPLTTGHPALIFVYRRPRIVNRRTGMLTRGCAG